TPFLTMTTTSALLGLGAKVSVGTSTLGGPGVNEVQVISFDGAITGGTFTLTFNNSITSVTLTTGPISWNANPVILGSNIQTALDSLLNIGPDNALVGGIGVTFQNALGN